MGKGPGPALRRNLKMHIYRRQEERRWRIMTHLEDGGIVKRVRAA